MSKKNNIENLFKTGLSNKQVNPPADAKRAIDKELFGKKPFPILLRNLAIIGLGICVALFIVFKAFVKDEQKVSAQNEIEQSASLKESDEDIKKTEKTPLKKNNFSSENVGTAITQDTISKELNNTVDSLNTENKKSIGAREKNSTTRNNSKSDPFIKATKASLKADLYKKRKDPKQFEKSPKKPLNGETSSLADSTDIDNTNNPKLNSTLKGESEEKNNLSKNKTSSSDSLSNASEAPKDTTVIGADSTNNSPEEDEPKKKNRTQENTTKNQLVEGLTFGVDLNRNNFKNEIFNGTNGYDNLVRQAYFAPNIYARVNFNKGFNSQIAFKYGVQNFEYGHDIEEYQYFENIDTVYIYNNDTLQPVIIDTNYVVTEDSSLTIKKEVLKNSISYVNIPVFFGKQFVLNPNGNANLKLNTSLGLNLQFTNENPSDASTDIINVNRFTMSYTLRTSLLYSIGDFDITLPLQFYYAPKARVMYSDTRIDPKSSLSLGLGIQYNLNF